MSISAAAFFPHHIEQNTSPVDLRLQSHEGEQSDYISTAKKIAGIIVAAIVLAGSFALLGPFIGVVATVFMIGIAGRSMFNSCCPSPPRHQHIPIHTFHRIPILHSRYVSPPAQQARVWSALTALAPRQMHVPVGRGHHHGGAGNVPVGRRPTFNPIPSRRRGDEDRDTLPSPTGPSNHVPVGRRPTFNPIPPERRSDEDRGTLPSPTGRSNHVPVGRSYR